MSAATAEILDAPSSDEKRRPEQTAEVLTFAPRENESPAGESEGRDLPSPEALMEEARLGAERLARLSHDELRNVISRRVDMLNTVLKERNERRAALEEALLAERVLNARRERARRIRRKVNIGTSVMAAMFTGLIVAGMF